MSASLLVIYSSRPFFAAALMPFTFQLTMSKFLTSNTLCCCCHCFFQTGEVNKPALTSDFSAVHHKKDCGNCENQKLRCKFQFIFCIDQAIGYTVLNSKIYQSGLNSMSNTAGLGTENEKLKCKWAV